MLSAGMGGTQANALSSRLIERGLLEYTKQCEEELNKGKIMLLVDTNTTYASAIAAGKLVNQDTVGHVEDITESPNILIVECNPDIESIMAEVEKEEIREKRTGSLAVQGEKNKPELAVGKKDEVSGTLTDSPVSKESKSSTPISAASVKKEETIQKHEDSSIDEENKNNKNQKKKK